MSQIDLLLLHPPSVYDFRRHAILYGPVSDLIPSSPVFEMYPLGFLTLTSYLEERGLRVRIVNLALRMMNDRRFDVPAFLAGLKPAAVGIDLHWLPHAHGAIKVAQLVNPPASHPASLDYVDIDPQRMVRMVLRYRDLQSVLPFNGWWQNPITAVFTVKGCTHECVTCGGSRAACALISRRPQPLFRSPHNLVDNMRAISRISKGPIFLVGDLCQGGEDYAYAVLDLLAAAHIKNEITFEFFGMPPLAFLAAIDRSVANWSLELSPESHDETIRRAQDHTTAYSNAELEAVIAAALQLRCHRIDIFFMIGLPQQTHASVMETIGYCDHLFQVSDRRLSCFISPLGPFIDPASCGYEEPERYGYRLLAHTLEEHRQLLVQPSWDRILNYETQWMGRAELFAVTYDAAEALNRLKLHYRRIAKGRGEAVARHIARTRALKQRLDTGGPSSAADQAQLRGEIYTYSVSTVCDKRELFWKRHLLNFHILGILRIVLAYVASLLQPSHFSRASNNGVNYAPSAGRSTALYPPRMAARPRRRQ